MGSRLTRIFLVVAITLLSVWSAAATPFPVLAGHRNVRYVYDGPNAEPEAAAVQSTLHGPDQRILADGAASAAPRRAYDHHRHLTRGSAPLARNRLAPNTASGGLRTVAGEVGEVRSYPS